MSSTKSPNLGYRAAHHEYFGAFDLSMIFLLSYLSLLWKNSNVRSNSRIDSWTKSCRRGEKAHIDSRIAAPISLRMCTCKSPLSFLKQHYRSGDVSFCISVRLSKMIVPRGLLCSAHLIIGSGPAVRYEWQRCGNPQFPWIIVFRILFSFSFSFL